MSKKYTFKYEIKIPVAATTEESQPNHPKFSISKYHCINCGYPLKRSTIRNSIICPNCGTNNLIE